MPDREPTAIGRVRHVLGAQVTVALDADLAGVAPIYRGRLQPIGQIGSLVRLPQGLVDLIGQVSLLGISELAGAQVPAEVVQTGERWLQVQLLGEIDRGTGRFERGVGSYPGLGRSRSLRHRRGSAVGFSTLGRGAIARRTPCRRRGCPGLP